MVAPMPAQKTYILIVICYQATIFLYFVLVLLMANIAVVIPTMVTKFRAT